MWNLLAVALCVPFAFAPQQKPVEEWLHRRAVPLSAEGAEREFLDRLGGLRVVGLGEATHGQREVFEFKRRVTLHLIRHHGFRLVAYEASATGALALDRYVQGESDDLEAAMSGFGMLIWYVEENRALLDDLRAWNQTAEAGERVEIIGVDVQDASGAADRLHGLLEGFLPDLADEALAVAQDLVQARNAAYGGETEGVPLAQDRLRVFTEKLFRNWGSIAASSTRTQADEAMRCARELARFPADPSQPGMRDRGMAETLLDALGARAPGTRAVLWGHNGHITKGTLRWTGTDEPGCGGVLRSALGENYYALGVAFGSGGFQALDRDADGKWWFREYAHGVPATDTLGHVFRSAQLTDSLIDLRDAPTEGPVREWLDGSVAMRSWGGYGVPPDPDAEETRGRGLAWTVLAADYDGLLYVERTSRARPLDPDRIWKE